MKVSRQLREAIHFLLHDRSIADKRAATARSLVSANPAITDLHELGVRRGELKLYAWLEKLANQGDENE